MYKREDRAAYAFTSLPHRPEFYQPLLQDTYIPGQLARLRDAAGAELCVIQKLHLDICNTDTQRSLLVKREILRSTSPADEESFHLSHLDGSLFTATRTYPGVEVDIRKDRASVARLSRREYLDLPQVWMLTLVCVARSAVLQCV